MTAAPPIACASEKAPTSRGVATGKGSFPGAALATRVLIIEDTVIIAWTLESQLEEMGFTDIEIASDGETAIAAATMRRPGLIVSDINLGSGLDGVAAVAAIVATGPVPALFVTGYAGAETRERIDRDVPGATVLRKPILSTDLRAAVLEALRVSRAQ